MMGVSLWGYGFVGLLIIMLLSKSNKYWNNATIYNITIIYNYNRIEYNYNITTI
jgi:hypothetical protein